MDCPICYETKENNLILECKHNVCLECYINILKLKQNFNCCLCRKYIHDKILFENFNKNKIKCVYENKQFNIYYDEELIKIYDLHINYFCDGCINMKNKHINQYFYYYIENLINETYKENTQNFEEITKIKIDEIYFEYKFFYCNIKEAINININNINITRCLIINIHNINCKNIL